MPWTATTVAVTIAAVTAFSPPIYVTTSTSARSSSAAAAGQSSPPSCVAVRPDKPGIHTWTFHIENGCPTTQRVTIDLSFRPDSECLIVPAESTLDWKGEIGLANQFEGISTC